MHIKVRYELWIKNGNLIAVTGTLANIHLKLKEIIKTRYIFQIIRDKFFQQYNMFYFSRILNKNWVFIMHFPPVPNRSSVYLNTRHKSKTTKMSGDEFINTYAPRERGAVHERQQFSLSGDPGSILVHVGFWKASIPGEPLFQWKFLQFVFNLRVLYLLFGCKFLAIRLS